MQRPGGPSVRLGLIPGLFGLLIALAGCGGNQPPTASILSPENNELMRNITVEFSATAQDPENQELTFQWSFGDGRSGAGANPTHAYAQGGEYTVTLTVTDGDQKTATDSIRIKVNNPPQVVTEILSPQAEDGDVLLKFSTGEAPLEVTVDASKTTDSDGSIFRYVWDFGDGASSTEVTASHVYEAPGEYAISLEVTDNMGSVAYDNSIKVTVLEPVIPLAQVEQGVHQVHVRLEGDGAHAFDPPLVRVQPGEVVRWVNDSGVHSVVSYSPDNQKLRGIPEDAQGWNSGLLTREGSSFEHTFDQPGTYAYFSFGHEERGGLGLVVVGGDDPQLNQDFLNALKLSSVRTTFAQLIGLGSGGLVHTIEMTDQFTFSPPTLRVRPGDTVKWVNNGQFPHSVVTYHPDYYNNALGIPIDGRPWHSRMDSDPSQLLETGDEWFYTIPQDAAPGTYAYFCLPHEGIGMVGLLIVNEYTPLSESFITTLPQAAQERLQALMQEAQNLE